MLRRTLTPRAANNLNQKYARRTVGFLGVAFVPSGATGVVERFGKQERTVQSGLNFYVPFIERVVHVSNMVQQAQYVFETKTKDNIFTALEVAAQVRVAGGDSAKALYRLDSPEQQIHAYLDSEIRAQVSQRKLDQLFEEQKEITESLFKKGPAPKAGTGTNAGAAEDGDVAGDFAADMSVAARLKRQGFTLVNVLIRRIEPDEKVKKAMNDINASLRMREAATNEADAKYILSVREAEADRDRKRLLGEGIAQQRNAIIKGYEDSISAFSDKLGLTAREVVDFIVKAQHLDAVEMIGKSENTKTIFVEHEPRGVFDGPASGNGGGNFSAAGAGAGAGGLRRAMMQAQETVPSNEA